MASIRIYDTEMVGDDLGDEFKKLFIFKDVSNQTIVDTAQLGTEGWQFDSSTINVTQTSQTSTVFGTPAITKTIRIDFTEATPTGQSFEDFILPKFIEDQYFGYHITSLELPEFDEKPLSFSSIIGDNYSHYNYKFEEYEDIIRSYDEKSLPNYMIGVYNNVSFTPDSEFYYDYFSSLNMGNFDMLSSYEDLNHFAFDDQTYDYSFNSSSVENNYFYKFSQLNPTAYSEYNNSHNHVFINFSYPEDKTKQTLNAPFYNKIRIPEVTETVVFLQNKIYRNAFTDNLMNNVLLSSFREADQTLRNFYLETTDSLIGRDVKIYSLFAYLRQFDYNLFSKEDSLFLRNEFDIFEPTSNSEQIIFDQRIVDLINEIYPIMETTIQNFNFDTIIRDNTPCYSEIIGYKIEKYGNGSTPIQTFYIPNEDKSIIDTQIKLDKTYTYSVFAMVAIAGVRYKYNNASVLPTINLPPSSPFSSLNRLQFDFTVEPSLQVAEVPLTDMVARIVEPPPISPEVTFYHETNSRNLLKISIENARGNYIDNLIEQIKIDKILDNDNIYENNLQLMHGEHYPFSSRAWGGEFQIFRMEEKPELVSDFADNLLTTVPVQTSEDGRNLPSLIYTDYIRHNYDYYYLIRSLTHRGNPGISSSIFKIRLIEDADEMLLSVQTIDLEKKELFTFENSMRKFLQIIPNRAQCVVNSRDLNFSTDPNNPANLNNLSLGIQTITDSLWEYNSAQKYFKIRLESKKTGKKIDLNLRFKFVKPT